MPTGAVPGSWQGTDRAQPSKRLTIAGLRSIRRLRRAYVSSSLLASAIVGDNAGYWLGLRYGYALLLRYGERIGMFEARIKLGQYLYLKHGAKVVFLGRFVALLRILAAFLAGVNRMPWRAFLMANASGGIIWAAVFGIGGYFFGKLLLELHHTLAPIVFALALAGCGYLVRRYEARLTVLAERALPGPLVAAVGEKRP